jgi:DNA-binding XRE family transcriptional regulator
MAQAFLPNGVTIKYEHTCTFEEMRFGTCNCRAAAIKAHKSLHGAVTESDARLDQENRLPATAEQEQSRFKAQLTQHLAAATCHDRLRFLRTATGWSQGELANELGISRRSVIRYEKGQHSCRWPRIAVLLRLQQLEGVYEQQLLAHFSGGT